MQWRLDCYPQNFKNRAVVKSVSTDHSLPRAKNILEPLNNSSRIQIDFPVHLWASVSLSQAPTLLGGWEGDTPRIAWAWPLKPLRPQSVLRPLSYGTQDQKTHQDWSGPLGSGQGQAPGRGPSGGPSCPKPHPYSGHRH